MERNSSLKLRIITIVLALIIVGLMGTIRYFENALFYDPFLKYFKSDYLKLPLPEFNSLKLVLSFFSRYFVNSFLSLALIFVVFKHWGHVRFSAFLLLLFLALIVVSFLCRHNGEKFPGNSFGVDSEQFVNALAPLRMKNKADVIRFRYAIDDFLVVVSGSVGLLLVCQRKDDARVILPHFRRFVWILRRRRFEFCPFAPEVKTAGVFQNVGDIRAADPRCNFQQIKSSCCGALQKLGMRHTALITERF